MITFFTADITTGAALRALASQSHEGYRMNSSGSFSPGFQKQLVTLRHVKVVTAALRFDWPKLGRGLKLSSPQNSDFSISDLQASKISRR